MKNFSLISAIVSIICASEAFVAVGSTPPPAPSSAASTR
jgi:hypothetical protein